MHGPADPAAAPPRAPDTVDSARHRFRPAIWGPPLLLVALTLLRSVPYRLFRPDDLYIYLTFVRNLLARGELSFNPGEPTYGFTSPLWLFLLAGARRLAGDPFAGASASSLVATLGSVVAAYVLALRLTGARGLAFLCGLTWGWNAWLLRWSWTGLEGGASALCVLAAVLLLQRASARDVFPWGAAVVSGVAPLVRPEMFGWWLLFGAHRALAARGDARRRIGNALLALAPGLAAAGGFACFARLRFGRFLPNTVEAKGTLVPLLADAIPAGTRILRIVASTSAVEIIVVAASAVLWLRSGGAKQAIRRGDPDGVVLMAAWAAGLACLYTARGVNVYTRYLLMLVPFVVIGAFAAVAPIWRRGGRGRAVVACVAAAILAQNAVLDRRTILPATRNYILSMEEVNVYIGRWLAENARPDATVAVPDIGAIGYLSGRRILDLNGLVTPDLIPFKRAGRIDDYLEAIRPDYIIDIDADPRHLETHGPRLPLRLLFSRPFYNMFVQSPGPAWYSVYEVAAVASGGSAPGGG